MRSQSILLSSLVLLNAAPALAQSTVTENAPSEVPIDTVGVVAEPAGSKGAATGPSHAISSDAFFSADGNDTDVIRAGLNLDWHYSGPEKYVGIRLEKAWFNPLGQGWRGRDRIYLRAANSLGGWKWNARVGTDGDTVLGAASLHDESPFRKEFFLEREIVETPEGIAQGIYSTFGGAAIDLPADDRNVFTVLVGLQKFTGDNLRTHVRANYIHVLKPDWGLSAQLRTRYFHSSDPGERDYYSPRWHAQVLPVLQLRRFTNSGWRYLIAGGYGVQRDSGTRWRSARYLNSEVTSPHVLRDWSLTGSLLYTNTPVSTGLTYSYVQFTLGVTRAF
jgi:hypothetical protein